MRPLSYFDKLLALLSVVALGGLGIIALGFQELHDVTCEEARFMLEPLEECHDSPGCALTLDEYGLYVELHKMVHDCNLGLKEEHRE